MDLPIKKTFITSSLVLLSFIGGLITSPYIFIQTNQKITKEIRKNFNYQYINPLLECEESNISQDKNLTSLKKEIEFIINQGVTSHKISFGAIYYRDLNNGPWISINANEYFSPASLIKVPVMIAYFKETEKDPNLLQKKITNTKIFDYSQQNITPTQILETDKEYTIEDLIERMIIYSDNAAYELLLENIDNSKIFQVYKDLDVDISKASQDPNGNIITVKDYASFFRILFNSSYLDQDNSEKALSILSKTQYYKGLIAGVPENITIAHKFGERQFLPSREKQLHDCGIVYLPNKPYLLCIMSRSTDFDKAASFIKEVSKTVYDYVSQIEN
ncbi:MAG: class A beta-lactamase-related serine hydrolase [Candidatus Shapirobacteria bacterium]|nr:class A beta-lactamase-related serine hydrolase [Candidatus Shapirobacteria bacterium]MDD4410244.1 class A beta-lactamase-related serine hydrolase [Candidatus Shapirobacteria bacterium]